MFQRLILFLGLMVLLVIIGGTSPSNVATQDVTEDEIVQYLMAPARSAEEQAVKDQMIWMRMADDLVEDLR